MQKVISASVWILVLALGIVSFILSYIPLRNVAIDYGAPVQLSFLWPLLIDGALVVFYLGLVRASMLRESVWWFWCLVGVATISTIFFNLVHASLNIVSIGVAIAPPLVLFFSTETLIRMIHSQARRLELSDTILSLSAKIIELEQETQIRQSEMDTERDTATRELDNIQDTIETRRQELQTINGQIEVARQRIKDTIGDTILIWSDTGLINPIDAGPDIRQAMLIEWARRGQDKDTIRDIYPDIFGKSVKTFDRDVANCNGQLVNW